jgi:DNA invertase Pin-like site-specific DNA recombinase
MKAVGYIRFSSDDQADGSSIERQEGNIKRYAERNGFKLGETLIDDGYSASKGEHISKGKLGRVFFANLPKYKGHALIVEELDRFSRLGVRKTQELLYRLLDSGIELHLTQTNRIIRDDRDISSLIMNLLESHAAEEYSRRLGERVGKAWASKKHDSELGTSITARLPGWLHGRNGEPITVDKEKAKIVRRIFEMAAAGHGRRLIARRLNQEGVPTFGVGKRKAQIWHDSYVQKILTNLAVRGTYQPFRRAPGGRIPDGKPREDFFPAIITQELWDRAQKSAATRRETNNTGSFAGRAGKINNLFSGLIFDATLGFSMCYEDKGKRSRPKLVTNSKNRNGISGNTIPYAVFEKGFLHFLDDLDWSTIIDIADSSEIKNIEREIADLKARISRSEGQIQTLVDKLLTLDTPAAALNTRLLKLEASAAEDRTVLAMAEKQLETAKVKHRDLLDRSFCYATLSTSKDLETRSRLREEIRRKVSRIEMNFGLDGWFCVAEVKFVNNAIRGLIFTQDGKTMVLRGEGAP